MSPGSAPSREDWITRFARFGDEREALSFAGSRIGYGALASAARDLAEALEEVGIGAGDLVAILAPPNVEGVALIHAMLGLGVVMLPLNARSSLPEQREALSSTHVRFLVMSDRELTGVDSLGARILEGLGCGALALGIDPEENAPRLVVERLPKAAIEAAALAQREKRVAEGAALVLRTSGTSGRPKGAVLGFDNLMSSARASAALLGSDARDRWLLCMPIFHIGGLSILIRAALSSAAVVLHERFDAHEVARALEDDGITRVSFVATMLERVLEVRGASRSPESLELVLLGGGPASNELLARGMALGYPIAPTYGLTEAASQVATRPPDRAVSPRDDLAGGLEPLPGVEIRVVDANRRPIMRELDGVTAETIEGEIEVRGPIVMRGYLDDPVATAEAIRDGWLATGDIGRLDAGGRLRVLDRRADLILSGGENVYPAEVESALRELEGVVDVGVFGIPDATYGARPAAVVVMAAGADFDPDALAGFCRARLAGYKRPVAFFAAAELPRTATGKLMRGRLREHWESRAAVREM